MTSALIGYTGFVGGNLRQQHAFDDLYNTSNIESIGGRDFELLVSAGASAAKWIANREPEQDLAQLEILMRHLDQVTARSVVLVSTIDVYEAPLLVDEGTRIDRAGGNAYGRHRLMLEDFFRERFEKLLIVRLPGLFGGGLKKNIIYDFLHDNCLEMINPASVYQFYSLDDLWSDITIAREAGLSLINLATEPVSVADVARDVFGFEFTNATPPPVARYDMRTRHAALYGGADGYIRNRQQVFSAMRDYILQAGWQGR